MAKRELTPEQRAHKRLYQAQWRAAHPRTHTPEQRESARARTAKWRADYPEKKATPEKQREAGRKYAAKNREKLREKRREFHKKNREKEQETARKYREKNRESILKDKINRRHANLERARELSRAWNKAHPEKILQAVRDRKARKRGASGTYTPVDIARLFEQQRGLCAACRVTLIEKGKGKYHVDHVMPLCLGGSNGPANLALLCPSCNQRKSTAHPDDWAKANGRLFI